MSWRNIWRNKVRSLVVIFAITIGLGGGIFISGMMNGMVDQQTDNAIKNEIANVQIHNPKFLDNMNPKFIIKKVDEKVELIDILEFVTGVCCRTKATGIASTATTETGVTLNGIMPEKEKAVTDIYQKLVQGHYFDKELNTAPILIGEKLSHKLKAGLGKKIVTTVRALNGEMSYALFRVTGIYKTNNSHFDEMNVFVLSADMNPILGIESGEANEIAIKTIDLDASFGVVDKLKLIFPELSIQSWGEIKPSLIIMITMMDQFSYWPMIIILFVLIFGIINTMLMVILERKRELGMLMAVGMNKKKVLRMILIETTLLSLTGWFLGLILSIVLIGWLGSTGINFASWAEGLEAINYSALIYPEVTNQFYIVVTILVIVTAVIASIWPTRKAIRLNPADAVRLE